MYLCAPPRYDARSLRLRRELSFMKVLGIETSCDETGIALYDTDRGLLAEALYSQVHLHNPFGGVVPELASRDHIRRVLPLINEVLTEAGIDKNELDGIAYTRGPGLIGALMVGALVSRSIAWGCGLPVIGVHHLEGHLLAPMLEDEPPDFPFLALLVSGGHTQLMAVKGLGEYQLLGESVDDAVGEAFDKTAKVLGLDYPGGPHVAALAEQGEAGRLHFPRPMTQRPGLDFSFSGLKTYVRNTVVEHKGALTEQDRADIALAFEQAVADTLAIKCRRALQQSGLTRLVIAGGVSANKRLRARLQEMVAREGANLYCARPELCTDNGAMIAYAGSQRLLAGQRDSEAATPRPRWPLTELTPVPLPPTD